MAVASSAMAATAPRYNNTPSSTPKRWSSCLARSKTACAMGTLLTARHAATSTLWNASQDVMSGTCPCNSACTVRHKSSAAFVLECRWSGPPSVKASSPQTLDKRRLRTPRPKTAGCSSKVCTINLHISRPPWEPNGMAGAAKNGQ